MKFKFIKSLLGIFLINVCFSIFAQAKTLEFEEIYCEIKINKKKKPCFPYMSQTLMKNENMV